MKDAPLPPVPHTTQCMIEATTANDRVWVAVKIEVPSRVAAHLCESNGFHIITSAGIGKPDRLRGRARGWKGGAKILAAEPHLHQAIKEGCDTPIQILITPEEWHLVGTLCGMLRITPGQWYLACAHYNAGVEENELDRQLEKIPAFPEI